MFVNHYQEILHLKVKQCHSIYTVEGVCNLLLVLFHCNYSHILYHFRDKARYWSKVEIFSYPCTL